MPDLPLRWLKVDSKVEEERQELQQIAREVLLTEGDIDRLRRKIDRLEARKNTLYLDIDRKLDEKL